MVGKILISFLIWHWSNNHAWLTFLSLVILIAHFMMMQRKLKLIKHNYIFNTEIKMQKIIRFDIV